MKSVFAQGYVRIENMNKSNKLVRDSVTIGLALFAMFFGAGSLIFPPYLGMESGTGWFLGFICFILADI